MPRAEPPADLEIMVRAARLHFEYGLTHEQAAEVLGLSRVKVTRLLKAARESGLVQITIGSDLGIFADLEEQLCAVIGVKEARVVPAAASTEDLRVRIAQEAARYLQHILTEGMVVALGLSRTLALMSQHVVRPQPVQARFVSLVGALREGGPGSGSPYEATQALATIFGGTAGHLHAPVVVSSPDMATELMRDPSIATTLSQAVGGDVAFVGVGGLQDRISLTEAGYVGEQDMRELTSSGAVGDIGGRFFDRQGAPVPSDFDRRVIGLTLEQFCRIPVRVIVGGGDDKLAAIAAAVRGGLASVLITDQHTALALIRRSGPESQSASESQSGPESADYEPDRDLESLKMPATKRRGRRRDG
jgi:lsr operon transcriptional repressor